MMMFITIFVVIERTRETLVCIKKIAMMFTISFSLDDQ